VSKIPDPFVCVRIECGHVEEIHALSLCHDVPRMTGFLRLGLYKGKKRYSRRHLGVFGTEKKDVYVCMRV